MTIVAIDKPAIDDAGTFPIPRDLHARVIENLAADGAKVIAYDVQFSEPGPDEEADQALGIAIQDAGNVVLATTETDDRGEPSALGGAAALAEVKALAGNANFAVDRSQVIRRVPYAVEGLKHFAVVTAERATGEPEDPADFAPEPLIDYAGPAGTYPAVSFAAVRRGRFEPGTFRGKVVFVGATLPTLGDIHATSAGPLMAGVEVHANAAASLLGDKPLREPPDSVTVLLVLLFGAAAAAAGYRISGLWAAFLSTALTLAYLVVAQLAFDNGLVLPVVAPLLALFLCTVGALAGSYANASFERERTRDLFRRFVPENVSIRTWRRPASRCSPGR